MGADEVYNIRPSFREKFRPAAVKPLIQAVLAERLADKSCAQPRTLRTIATLRTEQASAVSWQVQPGANRAVDARDRR